MSVGKPNSDDNLHQKRQRTASQDSIERRPAKKARSGPHHQFSRETINLLATSLPLKSTTQRAATDIGHNTKQDRIDFQRTSERRHSLPHFPLPYANSPPRLPLTEESLRLLNNCNGSSGLQHPEMSTSYASLGTSPSEKAIIACLDYTDALEERGVFFAAEFNGERPPGLDELWTALLAPRESPEPSEVSMEILRQDINDATTERATRDAILPKIIPVKALIISDTATSVPAAEWKSVLDTDLKPSLTAPKPDRTIGWEYRVFNRDFPKACASLKTFMRPVIGAPCLQWPLFTVESRGEAGSTRLTRLRNLHNGAVMLSNLYALKQKCGREETFFNKVHAMGVEIFDSCVQLSCYWATRSESGEIKYLGTRLQTWTLLNRGDHGLKEARVCIHNAIDRVRSEAQEWIRSDMQAIEDMLISVPLSQVRTSALYR